MTPLRNQSSHVESGEPSDSPDNDASVDRPKASRGWKIVGVITGVILATTGLVVLGFLVVMAVWLAGWGSSGGK